MRLEGNDHLVEFNEVYRVVSESDDQGGVDMFGDPDLPRQHLPLQLLAPHRQLASQGAELAAARPASAWTTPSAAC